MPPLPDLQVELLALHVGRIAPLGADGVPSAIRKTAVDGPVMIGPLGVAGDSQADSRHHGGADKALHLYPAEHYPVWRRELPESASHFEIGAFGENLATRGVDESRLCLGDVFTLGEAVIQVSQGRQPCAKLNLRFERPDMVERVVRTVRGGAYCRVLVPGRAQAGDLMILIERPLPEWSLTRLWKIVFGVSEERHALAELAASPQLSVSWRERVALRLAAQRRNDPINGS